MVQWVMMLVRVLLMHSVFRFILLLNLSQWDSQAAIPLHYWVY